MRVLAAHRIDNILTKRAECIEHNTFGEIRHRQPHIPVDEVLFARFQCAKTAILAADCLNDLAELADPKVGSHLEHAGLFHQFLPVEVQLAEVLEVAAILQHSAHHENSAV